MKVRNTFGSCYCCFLNNGWKFKSDVSYFVDVKMLLTVSNLFVG